MESKKRKPISKKTRFDIFKRDNFTCQYCSAKPPKIPLEVDHIIPVVNGGDNSHDNLITSCFDCNRGKGARELTLMPITSIEKIERLKIAQDQYKQFKKILDQQKKLIQSQIDEVNEIYKSFHPGWELSDRFRVQVKGFIDKIGIYECNEAMEIACSRVDDSGRCIKYFCGIVWNKIKNNSNA